MKWIVRLGLGLLAVVLVLIAVVAVRTATFEAPAPSQAIALAPAVPVDVAAAAGRLSQAIRFRTISNQDSAVNDWTQWQGLHAWLQASYPRVHSALRRETVAGYGLVYTWPGSDPALDPIVLMAHQDVVPVTAGTEGDWRRPPFAGEIVEGAVWGRGAVDDKGSLVALMEAAEILLGQGFQPRRTVIFVFGHDEEVASTGAEAAAALLKSRGITAEFTLDEGLFVITDNPVSGGPAGLIGVGEKGYATLAVTAPSEGGHSSSPPEDTGVITLARALVAIAEEPFPMKLSGPAEEMLRSLAPEAGPEVRMAVANTWLFEPLLIDQIASSPEGAALLHTTIAPTMLEGSPKENVLPQAARGLINYRIAPGDTSETVMTRARAAVGDLPVELAWVQPPREPTPVAATDSRGFALLSALVREVNGATPAPALVTGGTDGRYLEPVSRDVYRFLPVALSVDEVGMVHGTNEHITLQNLERMIQFYARLIATGAG